MSNVRSLALEIAFSLRCILETCQQIIEGEANAPEYVTLLNRSTGFQIPVGYLDVGLQDLLDAFLKLVFLIEFTPFEFSDQFGTVCPLQSSHGAANPEIGDGSDHHVQDDGTRQ